MDILNKENGHFFIGVERFIHSNITLDEVLSFDFDKEYSDIKNGYEWIRFKNLNLDNRYFFISICFFHKTVTTIDFCFFNELRTDMSWDNWNEQKELENLDRYEQWLNDQFDGVRKFDWGSIRASYDPRSAGSSICIWYDK